MSSVRTEPHHAPGSRVLVVIGRDGRTAPGVVRQTVAALDRDYRVSVNYPDGREWLFDAAPECVLPAEAASC